MSYPDMLREHAADPAQASRTFIRFEDARWTFAETLRAASAYAHLFLALRDPGRPFHVGLLLENRPEFVLADPGTIPNAVEEILRYWAPSQYQGRFTTAPATFHGVTIPAGVPALLITGAANRDERVYPDPDRFDIGREQPGAVGLGYGIHSCLGAALARLESRIAFEELRRRFPQYRVDEGGLRRVHMTNVAGFSHVPVEIAG